MSTPEQRERESEQSGEDKYHETGEQERTEREEIAKRLAEEELDEQKD